MIISWHLETIFDIKPIIKNLKIFQLKLEIVLGDIIRNFSNVI